MTSVAGIPTSPPGTTLVDPDPLSGPDSKVLGQERARRDNRAATMAGQLEKWLLRFARVEARKAVDEVKSSTVLTTILKSSLRPDPLLVAVVTRRWGDVGLAKASAETELERELRRILVRNGSQAFASSARRASGKRSTNPTDTAMREFLRQKEVLLQEILASVRRDVRASVRDMVAASVEEDPRPSIGELARRIRTQFHGDLRPGGPSGPVRDVVDARGAARRVLPTDRYRLTDGGSLYAFSSERAALIARTEMVQAENHGIVDGYRQSGVAGLEWLAYNDGRSGARRHDLMKGQKVRLGELFINKTTRRELRFPGDPNAHISEIANCIVGEALVQGGFDRLFRRRYRGDVIQLRTVGGTLTCTPNHPTLTPRGWVAASELQVGDDSVCYGHAPASDEVMLAGDHVQRTPAAICELYDSPAMLSDGVFSGIDLDFHGDGREGDVEIVAPYSVLSPDRFAMLSDFVSYVGLRFADIAIHALLGPGAFSQLSLRPALATHGGMGGSGEALPLRFGSRGHAYEHGTGVAPDWLANLAEPPHYQGPADVELCRQREHTGPAPVIRDKSVDVNVYPSHVVTSKSVSHYDGYVYNAETKSGRYVADGCIVHNCRCTVKPVMLESEIPS